MKFSLKKTLWKVKTVSFSSAFPKQAKEHKAFSVFVENVFIQIPSVHATPNAIVMKIYTLLFVELMALLTFHRASLGAQGLK